MLNKKKVKVKKIKLICSLSGDDYKKHYWSKWNAFALVQDRKCIRCGYTEREILDVNYQKYV